MLNGPECTANLTEQNSLEALERGIMLLSRQLDGASRWGISAVREMESIGPLELDGHYNRTHCHVLGNWPQK